MVFKNWFQFYTISLLVLYGFLKTFPPLAQHYSVYLNCASYFQGLAMLLTGLPNKQPHSLSIIFVLYVFSPKWLAHFFSFFVFFIIFCKSLILISIYSNAYLFVFFSNKIDHGVLEKLVIYLIRSIIGRQWEWGLVIQCNIKSDGAWSTSTKTWRLVPKHIPNIEEEKATSHQ